MHLVKRFNCWARRKDPFFMLIAFGMGNLLGVFAIAACFGHFGTL